MELLVIAYQFCVIFLYFLLSFDYANPTAFKSTSKMFTNKVIIKEAPRHRLRHGPRNSSQPWTHSIRGFGDTSEYISDKKILRRWSRKCVKYRPYGTLSINIHRKDGEKGVFCTQNFPDFYPTNRTTQYTFYADPGEVVRIVFPHFDVEGIFPCLKQTQSDFVEFATKPATTSDRQWPRFCGLVRPPALTSLDNYLRLIFVTGNDGFVASGFVGKYHFIPAPSKIQRSVGEIGDWARERWFLLLLSALCTFIASFYMIAHCY